MSLCHHRDGNLRGKIAMSKGRQDLKAAAIGIAAARPYLSASRAGTADVPPIDASVNDPAGVPRCYRESSSSGVTEHGSAVIPAVTTTLAQFIKGFVFALAVVAGVWVAPHPAAADDVSIAFIRALGDQAVSVIRSDMQLAAKAAYFQQMIDRDFDLTGICRFVLGPYWRVASPAEQQQFRSLFSDRLVHFYGRQLADSGDGDFVVTGSRSAPDGVIVTSRIVRPQGAPIEVDWRLGISDGVYKIKDVAIDGVSMALAQRSAISQLIARGGGQVGMLLATMRQEG
jgi:phospholipid transport system substrate-binding protein